MDKLRPMLLFYFSISLAIVSTVFYHICQKLTPANVNPALALAVTYGVSVVLCFVVLFVFFPLKANVVTELRKLNWASYALALALVGVEVSTLLACRTGWNISLAALVINITAAVLLVLIGLLLFNEKVALVNKIGVVVCMAGLVMVNLKL